MKRAVVLGVVAVLVGGCGSGPPSDSSVAYQLANLLTTKTSQIVLTQDVTCAHQTGDQYVCNVHPNTGPVETLAVTDDGHTIAEQGAAP